MPNVKKGESEQSYVSRCIPQVIKEGGSWGNPKAAAGKCYGLFASSKKKKKKGKK